MDSPQYLFMGAMQVASTYSFKPYYKWIVLNTDGQEVISSSGFFGFKPYYKWIVLNTLKQVTEREYGNFLSFKPYYKWIVLNTLNLETREVD